MLPRRLGTPQVLECALGLSARAPWRTQGTASVAWRCAAACTPALDHAMDGLPVDDAGSLGTECQFAVPSEVPLRLARQARPLPVRDPLPPLLREPLLLPVPPAQAEDNAQLERQLRLGENVQ